MAFSIFFKGKMLRHLWWYYTNIIFSLPMSLTMSGTGMTLDFSGFQQSFPWVQVLQCHLPLNCGKCNTHELAALVGCINLYKLVMLLKSTIRTCSLMHKHLFNWLQSKPAVMARCTIWDNVSFKEQHSRTASIQITIILTGGIGGN